MAGGQRACSTSARSARSPRGSLRVGGRRPPTRGFPPGDSNSRAARPMISSGNPGQQADINGREYGSYPFGKRTYSRLLMPAIGAVWPP
jgi:hypothetical protein